MSTSDSFPVREPLAAFFSGRIRSACDLAQSAINRELVPSPWLRGYFRELLIRELLSPLVPHTCRLVTGTVVDFDSARREHRREYPQDDILLVDGECLPPLFEVTGNGIYPVESVLARFEVKTTLDSDDEIRRAVDAAEEFWKLEPYMLSNKRAEKTAQPLQEARPLQILFTFNEIKGSALDSLRTRLNNLMSRNPTARFFLCVPGQLLWAYGQPYDEEAVDWYCCDRTATRSEDFPEVLSLIALLLQELPGLRELRRREARLSRYVRCLVDKKLVSRARR